MSGRRCGETEAIARPIEYREFGPSSGLAGHVRCLWVFRASGLLKGPYSHHVVPDGCIGLVRRLDGPNGAGPLLIMGPRLVERRVEIRAGDAYCGVRFRPDGGGPWLGLDPRALRDRVEPLALHAAGPASTLEAMLGGGEGLEASAEALDRGLREIGTGSCAPDLLVRRAVEAIEASGGEEPIAELARRLGVTERRLQRRFPRAVGLTPKQFARVRRVRGALAGALESTLRGWVGLAIEHGYSDQAHLSREVAQMTGLTLGSFRERLSRIALKDVDP